MSDKITEAELVELCKRILGFNDAQIGLTLKSSGGATRLVRMAAEHLFLTSVDPYSPDCIIIRNNLNSLLNGNGLDVRR